MHAGMFINGIPVSHAGNVVADCAFQSANGNPLLDMVWQGQGFPSVGVEQVGDDIFRLDLHADYTVMTVQVFKEEIL